MYTNTLIASAAVLAGTALAATPGKATIVNACTYPVYFAAVPAAGGGHEETSTILSHGQSWSQQWTELTNGNGWSLKLSKSPDISNPLQYEYTYHAAENIIWFDLSCVDGNPWNGNWEVSATGNPLCIPKQSFYRYATDDAFGMQDCPVDSDITVTICSGEDQAESIVSAVVASSTLPAAASTSPLAAPTTPKTTATTTQQPTTTTTHAVSSTSAQALAFDGQHFYNAGAEKAVDTKTTFATHTTAALAVESGHVVVVVETVIETAIAYETYTPGKRHVHHPEHPHFR